MCTGAEAAVIGSLIVSTGLTAASAAGAFTPDMPKVPPPPAVPTVANQQAELARAARDEKLRRAGSNIFTTPAGALVPTANLDQKKLFGQ